MWIKINELAWFLIITRHREVAFRQIVQNLNPTSLPDFLNPPRASKASEDTNCSEPKLKKIRTYFTNISYWAYSWNSDVSEGGSYIIGRTESESETETVGKLRKKLKEQIFNISEIIYELYSSIWGILDVLSCPCIHFLKGILCSGQIYPIPEPRSQKIRKTSREISK